MAIFIFNQELHSYQNKSNTLVLQKEKLKRIFTSALIFLLIILTSGLETVDVCFVCNRKPNRVTKNDLADSFR